VAENETTRINRNNTHPQTEEKKKTCGQLNVSTHPYIYTVFYHESSLIVSFIMTIITSISLLLLASLLPHLSFTGETDYKTAFISV